MLRDLFILGDEGKRKRTIRKDREDGDKPTKQSKEV